MKNVLLLGDSIRMQYQPKVKELLKGRANVYGPVENGRWSGYTLNTLRFWLPQMPAADSSIGITEFGTSATIIRKDILSLPWRTMSGI